MRSTNSIMSCGSSSPLATAITKRLGWEIHQDTGIPRFCHRPRRGATANAVTSAAVACFGCNLFVATAGGAHYMQAALASTTCWSPCISAGGSVDGSSGLPPSLIAPLDFRMAEMAAGILSAGIWPCMQVQVLSVAVTRQTDMKSLWARDSSDALIAMKATLNAKTV